MSGTSGLGVRFRATWIATAVGVLSAVLVVTAVVAPLAAQDRGLSLVASQVTGQPNFNVGRQYALIIGIDQYREWPGLRSAVAEAKKVRQILADRYYIDEFIELYNQDATAANIRRLFIETLPTKVVKDDSVFVFYSGHGYLDDSKTGFWIASDGVKDTLSQNGWIPNAQLRNLIGNLKAQRVLVMADACFSGDFLNVSRGAAPTADSAYFKKALTLVSRQVLTSGASETVPDDSEFGRQLTSILERNTEALLDPYSLYERLRLGVSQTLPLLGTLPGHEQGASFVFFLKPTTGGTGTITQPATTISKPSPTAPASSSRLTELLLQRELLADRIKKTSGLQPIHVVGWSAFGVGVVGTAVAIYGFLSGSAAYQGYQTATSAVEAQSFRQQAQLGSTLTIVGGSAGGLGLGLAPFLIFNNPAADLNQQAQQLDLQIQQLKEAQP